MAFLDNILKTIKRNTLDKTTIDERFSGGVKGLVNNVKANLAAITQPKIISPIPQAPLPTVPQYINRRIVQPTKRYFDPKQRNNVYVDLHRTADTALRAIPEKPVNLDFIRKNLQIKTSNDMVDKAASLINPVNLATGFVEGVANAPTQTFHHGYRLPHSKNAQEAIGHVAGMGEAALNVVTAGKAPQVGQLVKEVGKQGFKQALKIGAKEGAKVGAAYGATQGLQENADEKTVIGQFIESLPDVAAGAGVGAILGGATGGASGAYESVIGKLTGVLKKFQADIPEQKARDLAFDFIRNEAKRALIRDRKGRFSTKPADEPVFYTDFRKSLGLPEDGNYERGSIDLDAPLFGKEKSTTIPERVSPEPSLDVPLPLDEAAPGQPPAQPPKKTTDTDQFINESKQKFEKLYAQAIDRFDPLIQLGRKAKKETAVENSLAGYYGTGSTANYHVDFELAPILKEQDREALTKVAIALRDAELEGRGIQGSNRGVQVDQLRQELGDEKFQAVQGTLQKLYSYQDKMVRQYLVDTGIMSEQAYNAMRSKNQFYVPFKRVMDTVDDALGIPQAKGAASVSSQDVVKGIKGSKREIQDPLQSIIESTYKMVGLGKRQQVAKTIVGLKDQLPEGIIKPIKGTVGNKPTISLFENGKVQKYEVPPEVATAAKGMDEEGIATVFKILSQPTEIFRATATAYNPEFVIPNVVRDLQSAFVNVGLNPLKFVSGLAHLIKQDDVYQEFLKAGGQTSRVSIDRPVLEKKVGDIYSPAGIEVKNVFNFKKILQKMGEFSEQPTRIAAFEDAVKKELAQGATPEEARQRAAYMAQEATTNFARRGSKTKTVNALYAFLNARVQGIDRLARTIKKDPAGASFRMGLVSIAPAMAAYAWNRQFPSYNDERVVSARDKADNFILMLSDEPIEELKGAQFIKIPKGQVGKLANPLEEFMSFAEGKGGDVQEALLGVLSSFSPVDNIGDAIPTALRPPLENAANFNFFADQNIVPDYKKDYPPAYQYSSYTAPVYRMLGEETGKSPAKIQNLVEGYGTGIAKITEMATRPLIPEKYKSEKSKQGQDVNRTPILRRFLGGEKKTEEEAQAQQDKQQYGNIFKIRDIQSAMKRGDIPVEVGVAEIEKMQGQEPQQAKKMMFQGFGGGSQALPLEQERPKNAQEEKIADSIAKVKLQNSDKKFLKENGKYYVLNDEGNVNVIDLRETIAEPQLTGNSRLDKKIMAKFKGEITRRENDITKLYEAGLLSEEEAEQMLEELNGVRGGAGTGRKRKAKFGKLPDFSKTYKRMSKSRSLTRTVAQSKKKAQPPGAKSSIEDILTKKRKTSTIKSLLK